MTTTPNIFINYRRDDSPASAGRLYDRLADMFPHDTLFMDVDAMVPGVDFVRELDEAVLRCDVLLAIIGRNWLNATSPDGARRLENPEDFVRIEIATALRHGIRVIPVLVDGAQMPLVTDLPDDIKAMARRHAVELSHIRFASDAERLVRSLKHKAQDTSATARATERAAPEPTPAAGQTRPLSRARIFGACMTVFAIIASGAFAFLAAEPGTTYWLQRAGQGYYLWAAANVMVGPAVALKLWLPRFSMPHFWGTLGATFAALATLIGGGWLLSNFFLTDIPAEASGSMETIVNLGLREIPVSLLSGVALGYFLSQALGGWFAGGGGPGFVRRMIVIWTVTGTSYAVANFLLIATMEATAAIGSGVEAALIARATARMWSDTVLYGGAWALGFFLTFLFAPRSTEP